MSKYPIVKSLLEADGDPMPEVDFSADSIPTDPPVDDTLDISRDEFESDAAENEVVDVPNISLSETDKAVLGLIFTHEDAAAKARDLVDHDQNATEAIKNLIQLGIVSSEMGVYKITDSGKMLMQQNGLLSDENTISREGGLAAINHFY